MTGEQTVESADSENRDEWKDVDISEELLRKKYPDVLHALLKDHTRTAHEIETAQREGRKPEKDQWNIIWGTDNYAHLDEKKAQDTPTRFGEQDEITEEKITGEFRFLVRPRAVKEKEIQRQRSRDMAEVFTPAWVCNAQNNLVDEAWFGRADVFNHAFVDIEGVHRWTATEGPITFPEEPSRTSTRSWKDYVRDTRLEITCGEAPYLVSRYDAVTGQPIADLNQRIGLLDRKLRVVSENTHKSGDWLKWAQVALMATYGFEWQGDNLLLAREAIFCTVLDFHRAKFRKEPKSESLKYFAYIISWNLWQMDGLKMVLPYSCDNVFETNLLGETLPVKCRACEKGARKGHIGIKCVIRDWKKKRDEQKVVFETVFRQD